MKSIVVIADIVGSRTIPERRDFQRRLQRTLDDINSRSLASIRSPYTITLGDEFQVVYGGADTLFADAVHIVASVYPASVRFAVACGEVTTDINADRAIGMDGPAFAAARDLLTSMKRERRTIVRIAAQGARVALANKTLTLIAAEMARWNRNTAQTIDLLLQGSTTQGVAKHLDISTRAVYKQIKVHSLTDIVEIFALIREELHAGD